MPIGHTFWVSSVVLRGFTLTNFNINIMCKFLIIITLFFIVSCESKIDVGKFNFDDLPNEIQNQIGGAGCSFSFENEEEACFINGLMKINGLYEMLSPVDIGDEKTMIYINKNWEFELNIEDNLEEDYVSEIIGTVTLKSRSTDESKIFKVFGGCGC